MASATFPGRDAVAEDGLVAGEDVAGPLGSTLARIVAPAIATIAAGLLYRYACPPFGLAPLAWAVPALLLVPTRGLGARRAFACGVLFAFVMGAGVTGWAYDAARAYFGFGPWRAAAFVALVWLVFGGVQYGLLVTAYAALAPRAPLAFRGFLGAWLWAAAEVLRTWLFTGMPWELLGHTQHRWLGLIQIADLGGVYAVSFLMALVSVSVGELLAARRTPWRTIAAGLALPAAGVVGALAYGEHALAVHRTPASEADVRTAVVVQANLPSGIRWRRIEGERALAAYNRLSLDGQEPVDLIVWPEYAANLYLEREPLLRAQLAPVARAARDGLVLGAPRLARTGEAYNSAFLLDPVGAIAGTYDKRHLVPFTEYDPLGRRTTSGADAAPRFTAGGAPRLLEGRATKIGALICYEVLFPHLVRDLVQGGAGVLVNLSNEAWLDAGTGTASMQQLSMAVFPAIETRRFLVRASTTGVSGFVSPAGEVSSTIPVGTAGTARAQIAVRHELTPYVRIGEAWLIPAGLLAAAVLLAARRAPRSGGAPGIETPSDAGAIVARGGRI